MKRKSLLYPGTILTTLLALSAAISVGSTEEFVDHARDTIDKYSQIPDFVAPGPAFDARSCMAGKRILSIPASSAIPFTNTIMRGIERLAQEIGFTYQIWENQGQASQHLQGMEFGISNGFDTIDLLAGADPRVLEPQIAQAQAAGIKVVAPHLTGLEQPIPSGLDAVAPIPYLEAGELMAYWAIAQTQGEVNALVLVSHEVLSTESMLAGIKRVFDEECPDCNYRVVNIPIVDWASRIQSTVQSAVLSDPSLNYVLPIYDSMSQFVVPALNIAGAQDRVNIATFNGTPFVLEMIRDGDVEMDVGESMDWIAYGVLDFHMRQLCEVEPRGAVFNAHIPLRIFHRGNIAEAGETPDGNSGFGEGYVDEYRRLWMLQ